MKCSHETLKLQANALDRASTACLTVGVLAPAAAYLYQIAASAEDVWRLLLGGLIWLAAALILHLLARRTLKGLRS